MKRNITAFFLIVSLLFFTNSSNIFMNTYSFNHTAVKNNINYLSSDYFKGRLAGTVENFEVTGFIKDQFKQLGLAPFNGDYLDPFDANYPNRLDENPYLKILDKNGALIKEYKYGTDYKEEMLNFKKNKVTFSNKDSIKQGDTGLQVSKGADSFLFFVPDDSKLTFRSSFVGAEGTSQSMYIMLTKDTLSDIKKYLSKNYKISCYIPIDVKQTTLSNVIGYIEGKDSAAPPVIISAHFDHVGTDLSGTVYHGALDNASGMSFVMEFIKYISSLGMPDRNIIFIGFNAEEFGCLGSEHFVKENANSLKGAKVYNFDMIGSSSVPLSIMGGKDDTNKSNFMRSIVSTCINEKVNYNFLFEDASDHEYFRKNGIDAVTFCDSDVSKIHTPDDKIQYISTGAIDRCFKIASKEVIKNGFSSNPMLLYDKNILIYSGSGFILLAFLYKIINKRT